MKLRHRGYEIVATRERALGGWSNTYYHAVRLRDGFMLFDGFSEGDTPRYYANWMKRVIEVLVTKFRGRVDRLDDAIDAADERKPAQ